MKILNQLANVSLKELLANSLNGSLGLQLNWEWDEKILQGRDYELYFVDIIKNETHVEFLQQFIQKWKPVYEQLSLQHDYLALRLETATKDSYNVTVQLEELMKDVHTPRVELWMEPTKRGQLIDLLDESISEEKRSQKHNCTT